LSNSVSVFFRSKILLNRVSDFHTRSFTRTFPALPLAISGVYTRETMFPNFDCESTEITATSPLRPKPVLRPSKGRLWTDFPTVQELIGSVNTSRIAVCVRQHFSSAQLGRDPAISIAAATLDPDLLNRSILVLPCIPMISRTWS
jgi:hypothetical protein